MPIVVRKRVERLVHYVNPVYAQLPGFVYETKAGVAKTYCGIEVKWKAPSSGTTSESSEVTCPACQRALASEVEKAMCAHPRVGIYRAMAGRPSYCPDCGQWVPT